MFMESIQDMLLLFAQKARKIMGDDLKKLLVYGSYARGDYDENSDIDIMILTSLPENKIEQAEDALYDVAFDFMMEYGVQISVIVKNEEHFNYWLGALPFYDNVKCEGVEIIG
jgi:predicted nucleotidyltransferase